MISTEAPLHFEGYTLFRDDAAATSGRRRVYVLPDAPRVEGAEGAAPALELVRYVRADGSAWGSLSLSLTVRWRAEDEPALARAAAVWLDATAPVDLLPLPAHEGTLTLHLPRLEAAAGATDAALQLPLCVSSGGRASFFASLSGDDAALLLATLRASEADGRPAPILLEWRAVVRERMGAVQLRVWADATGLDPSLPPEALAQHLRLSQRSGIALEAGPAGPLPPEDQARLEAFAQAALDAFTAHAAAGGPSVLRLSLTGDALMDRVIVSAGPLAIAPGSLGSASRLREVRAERGWFDVLEVRAFVRPWPEGDPVRSVTLYFASAPAAPAVHVEVIGPEGGEAVFRAPARDVDAGAAHVWAEVRYHGHPAPHVLAPRALESGQVWVLSAADLGVFEVRGVLGLEALQRGDTATVELERPEAAQRVVWRLGPERPEERWRVPELPGREGAAVSARVRVTWDRDGEALVEPWRPLAPGRLLLAPPAPAAATGLEVAVLSAGSFDGIEQVVAELAGAPPPGGAERGREAPDRLTFTAPGQERAWLAPGPEYAVRLTVVYADGARRTEPWRTTDLRVCVVRDAAQMTVSIDARLLGLGQVLRAAVLELAYDGHAGPEGGPSDEPDAGVLPVRAHRSLVAGAPVAPWRFRLAHPDRREWRWRLTSVRLDGARTTTDWRHSREDVLVLASPPDGRT